MRYSGAVEQACCMMGVIAESSLKGDIVTNEKLSSLLSISSSYAKKITRKLVKGNLISATYGVNGGFRLAKHPKDITLLDVVVAIEGDGPLFQPVGLIEKVFHAKPKKAKIGITRIEEAFQASENKARQELKKLSMAAVIKEIKKVGDE